MKGSEYKGYGNNEYGLYVTNDNGKTWELKNITPVGSATELYDRLIFGSTSDGGLTYSDDNGVTIENSNILNGNWSEVTIYDGKVYSSSLDGEGIVVSTDRGETWTRLCAGGGEKTVVTDEGLYVYGNGIVTLINKENASVVAANATVLQDGTIVALPAQEEELSIPGILLIILNKFLLPKIIADYTGYTDDKVSQLVPEISIDSARGGSFFTNEQLYKVSNNSTIINWEQDVGMQPFSIEDISINDKEVVKSMTLTNDTISKELLTNTTLKSTFDLMRQILEKKRDIANQQMANEIKNVPVDSSTLITSNLSDEDLSAALEVQKLFYDVQKGAVISIMGTLINSIYTFDNGKMLALLKSAMYETLLEIAPAIQYKLNMYAKSIGEVGFELHEGDIPTDYNFAAGLETAIQKYLNSVLRNVRYMTESNDKNLITIAVYKYKEIRQDLLQDIVDYLSTVAIQLTEEEVKALGDIQPIINQCIEEANTYAKDSTASQEEIENYLRDNVLKRFNDLIDKDKDKLFNQEGCKNKLYEKLKGSLSSYVNSLNVASTKYNGYFDLNDDEFNNMSSDDKTQVTTYYNQIINKFKSRCIELFDITFGSYKKNSNNELISRLKLMMEKYIIMLANKSSNKEELNIFIQSNTIKSVNVINSINSETVKILKRAWVANKEMI